RRSNFVLLWQCCAALDSRHPANGSLRFIWGQTLSPVFGDDETCDYPARGECRTRAVYDEVRRDAPVSLGALLSHSICRCRLNSSLAGSFQGGAQAFGVTAAISGLRGDRLFRLSLSSRIYRLQPLCRCGAL